MPLFTKILIANRGEIVCRIIKTAKKLGIQTVSIFSDADIAALHTKLADEAFYVGPSPSSESYLNSKRIIEIALQANVQAIHPGYGFLSENSQFASLCEQAGICFIGPSAKSIQLMGEKHIAKEIVAKHYIPVLADYKEEDQSEHNLLIQADKIGYPILIKAIAGGGGKGMRVVSAREEFKQSLQSAKREALASFANDRIFLEKYLPNARHIEVQLLADKYHNVITLFERDCSIQRRHQKILEEAPAPNISGNLRDQLRESALIAARAISYHNVGTVEFLVTENENFYFMEMNTRLQVEHPVTEMINGLDLVEWQIRVAAGEELPFTQPRASKGHAFEARICAEEPEKDFLPSTGKLVYFNLPTGDKIRIDTGYVTGDDVSIYYDSLLAKIIVLAETREHALARMTQVLDNIEIVGVATNLKLLQNIVTHADFIAAKLSTHFLESGNILSELKLSVIPNAAVLLAGIGQMFMDQKFANEDTQNTEDCFSPWLQHDVWQLNSQQLLKMKLIYQTQEFLLEISLQDESYEVLLNNKKYLITPLQVNFDENKVCHLELKISDNYENAKLVFYKGITIFYKGKNYFLQQISSQQDSILHTAQGHLRAPMPGTIIELLVNQGQSVNKGDKLLVIEAMKMEHTIYAPSNGIVAACHYAQGDLIEEGVELLEIKLST